MLAVIRRSGKDGPRRTITVQRTSKPLLFVELIAQFAQLVLGRKPLHEVLHLLDLVERCPAPLHLLLQLLQGGKAGRERPVDPP